MKRLILSLSLLAVSLSLQAAVQTTVDTGHGHTLEQAAFALVSLFLISLLIYTAFLLRQIRSNRTELERTAAQWTYAMDFLEDPMYLVDLNDIVLRANKAFYRQVGKPEAEVLGKDVKTLIHLKPEKIPCPGCQARLDRRDAFFTKEVDDPTNPIGKPIEVTIRVVRDESGEPTSILCGIRDLSHLRHTENALRDNRKKLNHAQRIARMSSWTWDLRSDLISGSDPFYEMFGIDPSDHVSMDSFIQGIPTAEQQQFKQAIAKAVEYKTALSIDHPIITEQNKIHIIHQEGEIQFDSNGSVIGLSATAQDVTRQKQTESELIEAKERAQVTLAAIGDAVLTVSPDGVIEYVNAAAESLIGLNNAELCGKDYHNRISLENQVTRLRIKDPIERCLAGNGHTVVEKSCVLVARDGSEYIIDVTAAPIRHFDNQIMGCVLVLHDVTQMHNLTRMLNHQATHDPLTGLINRREFDVRLRRALDNARVDDLEHSLVYIDLDNFKIINDNCGHLAGDELLKQFTMLVHEKLRNNDTFARLGGDEFAILLHGCPESKAMDIVTSTLEALKQYKFQWSHNRFDIGASFGLTAIRASSNNSNEVLNEADSACYLAKRLGRNRIQVYDQHNFLLLQHRGEMQWVQKINQALEKNRFRLYCQKIMSLTQESEHGFYEFLLRLSDDSGKIIGPGEFIPAAERFQLMPLIDRWVVKNVFQFIAMNGLVNSDFKCAINLSAQSICDREFVAYIIEQLHHWNLQAWQICFEITETAAIDNLVDAEHFIFQLRDLGFEFSLDDFGSGMSSFAYLKQLKVDYLKIDGMFIKEICKNQVDRTMVSSIHAVADLMGIQTIAEFVEDKETTLCLKELGISYAQGHAINKPQPVDTLTTTQVKHNFSA
ncbi:MAG: EAL domain-containing protein [Gammaproteobacteria bacterium]|nr:EAL domain-containing protein [Gammaproteobacteria bacterium]MDH5800163.1 EAL domain-containing protein [Gammaproteobacteria bacterium]